MLAIAEAVLEISYTDPADPKSWEDETTRLRAFNYARGAPDELEQSQSARAQLLMDNDDGALDPTFDPTVLPMRAVRLRAKSDPSTTAFRMRSSSVGGNHVLRGGAPIYFPLFQMFIDRLPQTWPDPSDAVAEVNLDCFDGFGALTDADFLWGHRYKTLDPGPDDWPCGLPTATNVTPDTGPPNIPDELTGARINRVLDCFGWPSADRDIDDGATTVLGSSGNQNMRVTDRMLSHIQSAALTEGGRVFVDREGRIKFIDAPNLPPANADDVFGDDVGEKRYRNIVIEFGLDRVWNVINVTTTHPSITGESSESSDATSLGRYFEHPKEFTVLPAANADLVARRNEMLARYKEPVSTITSMEMRPSSGKAFRDIVRHELADMVRVKRRPRAGGTIVQDSRIESISVSARPSKGHWDFTWQLSAL